MQHLKSTWQHSPPPLSWAWAGTAHAGATLDAIQKKGFIQCGVSDGLPGFGVPDAQGKMTGIDVDVCHAVAAAVFGDASKVKFTQLTAKERFHCVAIRGNRRDLAQYHLDQLPGIPEWAWCLPA
jgi:general L-amino acid transport system substrate-binding protein